MKKQTNAEEANNRNDFVTEADVGVEISINHRDLSVGYDFGEKKNICLISEFLKPDIVYDSKQKHSCFYIAAVFLFSSRSRMLLEPC